MNNAYQTPSLAIAIPTFNRGRILEENIKIILAQTDKYPITIYISDNCSSDETQSICRELQNKNDNIKYSRNNKNIGFDGNILKLLEWIQGDYIWFLGDDDFLTNSAISSLFQIITIEHADAYILNGSNRGGVIHLKNKRPTTEYNEINNFLSEMWCHQTWMSSIVIRHDLISDFDGGIFDNSLFMHVQVLNHALTKSNKFKLIYDSRVFATYPNEDDITNHYAAKSLWLFVDRWSYNIDVLPPIVNNATRLKCKKSTNFRGRTLFTLRGQGNYSLKDYENYKFILREYGFIHHAWLAANLPITFCHWLSTGIKKARRVSIIIKNLLTSQN